MEQVGEKYCDSTEGYAARNNVYKQYVETIAPGAFEAYSMCLKRFSDVIFYLDQSSVLAEQISISVNLAPKDVSIKKGTFAYSVTSGVTCKWTGYKNNLVFTTSSKEMEVFAQSTAVLDCKRQDGSKEGFIKIVYLTGGGSALVVPWKKYDSDGIKIDTIDSISKKINQLRSQLSVSQAEAVALRAELNKTTSRLNAAKIDFKILTGYTNPDEGGVGNDAKREAAFKKYACPDKALIHTFSGTDGRADAYQCKEVFLSVPQL